MKVLGVTLTNHLSVSDHVRDVICRCGQSLYAIKVLRCHGINEEELMLTCLQVSCISEVDVRVASLVGVCHRRRQKTH